LIFNMPIWYVIVTAFIYFIVVLLAEIKKISVKEVEKNNPELQEMLRTAKDNEDDESIMAHALFHEVLGKMRKVSSGTFMDFQKLMTKLGAIFVLAIVLVSIAFFNINISKFDNPLERPLARLASLFGGSAADQGGFDAQGATDDIFGDSSMARLGDDRLTATINPQLDNPDFNNVDPANPSSDPLADLGSEGGEFNSGGPGFTQEGIDDRDLQRSYEYAKRTQG